MAAASRRRPQRGGGAASTRAPAEQSRLPGGSVGIVNPGPCPGLTIQQTDECFASVHPSRRTFFHSRCGQSVRTEVARNPPGKPRRRNRAGERQRSQAQMGKETCVHSCHSFETVTGTLSLGRWRKRRRRRRRLAGHGRRRGKTSDQPRDLLWERELHRAREGSP